MRAITVRQPWAWSIVHGGKDVENRTRNIAGDYRGPVAIHVGKQIAMLGPMIDSLRPQTSLDVAIAEWWQSPKSKVWLGRDGERFDRMPWWADRGAIIGVVDLVDVHWSGMECSRPGAPTCHEYEQCSPWGMAYYHHLILANPRPLVMPIPAAGKLGLWRMDEALIREVGKELPGWEVQALTEAPGADGVGLGTLET